MTHQSASISLYHRWVSSYVLAQWACEWRSCGGRGEGHWMGLRAWAPTYQARSTYRSHHLANDRPRYWISSMPSSLEETTWSLGGKLTVFDTSHHRKPMISLDRNRHIPWHMGFSFLPVGPQPAPLSESLWSVHWLTQNPEQCYVKPRNPLCCKIGAAIGWWPKTIWPWNPLVISHTMLPEGDSHFSVVVAFWRQSGSTNLEMILYKCRVLSSRTWYTVCLFIYYYSKNFITFVVVQWSSQTIYILNHRGLSGVVSHGKYTSAYRPRGGSKNGPAYHYSQLSTCVSCPCSSRLCQFKSPSFQEFLSWLSG